MKLIVIFTLLVVLSTFDCVSQVEWASEDAEWYYSYSSIFDPNNILYARTYKDRDTIIAGKQAKILRTTIGSNIDDSERFHEEIIVYQQDRQLYRYIDGYFRILYDFTLELGDTFKIYVPEFEFYGDSIAYFIVDSISKIEINDKMYDSQLIRPLDKGALEFSLQFGGWSIEGVGNFSYFIPVDQLSCDDFCTWPLRCYNDNDIQFKRFDIPCDTTVLISNTNDLAAQEDFLFFPNPGGLNGKTTINLTSKANKIEVFSITGELVSAFYPRSDGNQIIQNPSQAGIYLINIEYPRHSITKKLVIAD